MTKDKTEEIRKACIASNPEIIELKFGCEFLEKGEKYIILNAGTPIKRSVVVGDKEKSNTFVFARWCDDERMFEGELTGSEEIIGRPIRLADVLLALQKGSTNKRYIFIALGGPDKLMDLILLWNLKDNNLENQSPETIDFIHGLLHD